MIPGLGKVHWPGEWWWPGEEQGMLEGAEVKNMNNFLEKNVLFPKCKANN